MDARLGRLGLLHQLAVAHNVAGPHGLGAPHGRGVGEGQALGFGRGPFSTGLRVGLKSMAKQLIGQRKDRHGVKREKHWVSGSAKSIRNAIRPSVGTLASAWGRSSVMRPARFAVSVLGRVVVLTDDKSASHPRRRLGSPGISGGGLEAWQHPGNTRPSPAGLRHGAL